MISYKLLELRIQRKKELEISVEKVSQNLIKLKVAKFEEDYTKIRKKLFENKFCCYLLKVFVELAEFWK